MLGDKVVLCIVGNKIDLDKKRTVEERSALEYVFVIVYCFVVVYCLLLFTVCC